MEEELGNTKKVGVIKELSIAEATFEDGASKISPNVINFFYGQNGTGKSTIASTVEEAVPFMVVAGKKAQAYDYLIFNQAFVERNMTKVNNENALGAVFMLDAKNREINNKISKKRKEMSQIDSRIEGMNGQLALSVGDLNKKKEKAVKAIYSTTSEFRMNLPLLFQGSERKSANELFKSLKSFSSSDSVTYSRSELLKYYSEFIEKKSEDKEYPILSVDTYQRFDKEEKDLAAPLIDSSNTQFRTFLESIGSANWFLEAYTQFQEMPNAKGRCPYCQRELQDGFDECVSKSFDKTYSDGIRRIKEFQQRYSEFVRSYCADLKRVSDMEWAVESERERFIKAMTEITTGLQANASRIQKKINDPAWKIVLLDLGDHVGVLLNAIFMNNEKVRRLQRLKTDPKAAIIHGREMMLSIIVSENASNLERIAEIENQIDIAIKANEKAVQAEGEKKEELQIEIDDLIDSLNDTGTLVDEINKLIRQSGFDGFHLEEINATTHEIMVFRDKLKNGAKVPPKRLSEGEKNFIMFLYFYFMVKGTVNSDGSAKDKIVVIDDPVTSMDSQALHFIASLIKELVCICANNFMDTDSSTQESFIKQFFLLSHNPYFFRDVSDDWIEYYEWVNYYLVTKRNNISNIRIKMKRGENPLTMVNDYPIKNAYQSLWEQFNDRENNAFVVMNSARQIIDHYFVQMIKSSSKRLKEVVLKDNKQAFIKIDKNGREDTSDYAIAQAILSCLTNTMEDDFSFDRDSIPPECIRSNLKRIFEAMNHPDHYAAMSRL